MKVKALLLALFALGVTASVALAGPPSKGKPGLTGTGTTTTSHGKPSKTGPSCRPRISVVLSGTLVTPPGASGTTFTMTVAHVNHHAKAYKAASPVTISIDASTTFRRQGSKSQASLLAGDRVQVQARACKADLASEATPPLTAVRVVAHGPGTHTDTTETETTTTTTTTES